MGLKTNKTTNTSRLNCQYVGSFPVRDGDRKLTTSQQNKFVDEKLKSCQKKLISGMPVCLEVSPDGVRVMAIDEKTVKMAHSLRRISYAKAEPTNKLFAYVSHQPGTDMEIVCHTFLAKKKDHSERLSAALGKLFKQTFAYTLKRRDKLEEAAQKRGGNRRWAKQQIAEGHSVSEHARNAARNAKPGSMDAEVVQRRQAVASPERTHRPARRAPPAIPDEREQHTQLTGTNEPARHTQPAEPEEPSLPSQPVRPNQNAGLNQPQPQEPSSLSRPTRPNQVAGLSPPTGPSQPVGPSQPAASNPPLRPSKPPRLSSPAIPSAPEMDSLAHPSEVESIFDVPSNLYRPEKSDDSRFNEGDSPLALSKSGPTEDSVPPCLPKRTVPMRSNPPGFAEAETPLARQASPWEINLMNNVTPTLPKCNPPSSSSELPSCSKAVTSPSEGNQRVHRKQSAPPDLMPSTTSHHTSAAPRRNSESYTEQVSPTWFASTAKSRDLLSAANVLLAGASDTPPPLPQRQWSNRDPRRSSEPGDQRQPVETGEQRRPEAATIPEEDVFDDEEDEELKGKVSKEPRVSLTLEDEDWYVPGVSRELVTEMLETSEVGTFFVRDSQSCPGCYALTMKVVKTPNNPSGFANYLIVPEEGGFALQGFNKVFEDISSLIRHHALYEDGLPCRLILAGSNPLFNDANGYLVEFLDEENDTYLSLSYCSSMFKELEINGNVPW